jgi:hypothetical protein
MRHRRPGECERCNDVAVYGRKATHLATPTVEFWPAFRTCHSCAIELLRWPAEPQHPGAPYSITSLQPAN